MNHKRNNQGGGGSDSCCSPGLQSEIKNDRNPSESEKSSESSFRMFLPVTVSFVLLILGITFDAYFSESFFRGWVRLGFYFLAYLPVGFPVIKEAFENLIRGEVFTEFFLMSIATIGAFYLEEYPEGVAVMLFYSIGEVFQNLSVQRAKLNIKNLLDQRPDRVFVVQRNETFEKKPRTP